MALFRREPVIGEAEDARLVITGKFPNFVVTYGDHEIKQMKSLTLDLSADDYPEVTIRILPNEIEVDAEAYAAFEAVFDRKVGVTEKELP